MFSRTDRRGPDGGLPSIVSAGMTVTGDITGDSSLQVEGTVTGDVRCRDVTVGRGAEVRGHIEAETVRVNGSVVGEIRADSVVLSETARVSGDIVHEQVSIEAGAHVEGQLLRRDAQQSRLNLVVGDNT